MLTGNGAFCFTVEEKLFVSLVMMLGGFVQVRRRNDLHQFAMWPIR